MTTAQNVKPAQDAKGFEKNFIDSCSGWDDMGIMSICFYDAVLNRDIGLFKKGETVKSITFDLQTCTGQVFDGKEFHDFSVKVDLV